MPKLSRSDYYDLARDMNWRLKYVTEEEAFPADLAGAVPPQSLILYAPRNEKELKTIWKIIQAAYSFSCGRVGDLILPDTAW